MIFGSMYSKTVQLGTLVITFWAAIFQKHRGIWNFPGIIIRHFCLKKKIRKKSERKKLHSKWMLLQDLYLGTLHYRLVCTFWVYMKQNDWFCHLILFIWRSWILVCIPIFSYHVASDGHPKLQLKYSI